MPKIFVSYRCSRIEEVTRLTEYLHGRGVKTWQDVRNLGGGRQTEDAVRTAISKESDGFVLYLSRDVEESNFIRKVEVPAALSLYDRDHGYLFIPIFEGTSFDEAKSITQRIFGRDLTGFNGTLVPRLTDNNHQEFDNALEQVAKITLRSSAEEFGKAIQSSPRPIRVHLESYQSAGEGSDFKVNIEHVLERKGINDQELWTNVILPGLKDLCQSLAHYVPVKDIEVKALAHISFGIAFGFTFCRPTGFRLVSLQGTDTWASDATPDENLPLKVDIQSGNVDSDYASVELSIARDVSPGVQSYMAEKGLSFRVRCILAPEDGASRTIVSNGSQAVAVVNQVIEAIDQLRKSRNVKTIHLFAAVPISLAIILGHYLNARGPIQVYEWDKPSGSYLPTWLLA